MTVKAYMQIKGELRKAFILSFGCVPSDILLLKMTLAAKEVMRKGGAA